MSPLIVNPSAGAHERWLCTVGQCLVTPSANAAGTDIYQLLQHCTILKAALLATLVLLAISPPAMHFYLHHFLSTTGILDSQKREWPQVVTG